MDAELEKRLKEEVAKVEKVAPSIRTILEASDRLQKAVGIATHRKLALADWPTVLVVVLAFIIGILLGVSVAGIFCVRLAGASLAAVLITERICFAGIVIALVVALVRLRSED